MRQDLLNHYTPRDFYFSSPTCQILTHRHLEKASCSLREADNTIARLFNKQAQGEPSHHNGQALVIAGAFPFDQSAKGTLLLSNAKSGSEEPSHEGPDHEQSGQVKQQHEAAIHNTLVSVQPRPDRASYIRQVEHLLEMFAQESAEKVVLSRTLKLNFTDTPDPKTLLRALQQQEPNAFVFAMPLSDNEQPHVFCGASPELLIRREGRSITLNPLAGSTARYPDPQADLAAAASLLTSKKDHQEHAIVVEAIRLALAPLCVELEIPDTPELLATSRLWHLSTVIRGKLRSDDTTSLQIARCLHPTPAVCGAPRDTALALIHQLESFDRGLFCGLVGWMKANGDGEWAISLRCADITAHTVTLFAGAGVITSSDPVSEFNETGTKLTTLLPALGVDEALAYLEKSWRLQPQGKE